VRHFALHTSLSARCNGHCVASFHQLSLLCFGLLCNAPSLFLTMAALQNHNAEDVALVCSVFVLVSSSCVRAKLGRARMRCTSGNFQGHEYNVCLPLWYLADVKMAIK